MMNKERETIHLTEPTTELKAFKPYPEYKDSGVEWLGKIPCGWKIKRLKYIAQLIMGQSPPSEVCNEGGDGTPFLQGNAEFGKEHPVPRLYCPNAAKKAPTGSHLISVRAPVGAVNTADQEYGIGRGLCAVWPLEPDFESRFCRYTLEVMRWQLDAVSTGSTYEAVSANEVGNLFCILSSLDEQRHISSFLDRETSKIDALISEKERLIGLLQEKRTALITHAITKGLDPKVKMKDSGVEWVGEIPALWEIKRLKNIVQLNPEVLPETTDPDYLIQYIDITNVDEVSGVNPPDEMPFDTAPSRARRIVRSGDTILSTVRTYLKAVAYFENPPDNLIVSTGFAVLRPDIGIYPPYIFALIRCQPFIESVVSNSVGVAYPAINPSELAALPVWAPPTAEEQEAIVEYLEKEISKIDGLIAKIREAIDRLKEYRTALISAAVTGKIDVRPAMI
jgi:type I restriction enzyme S subunit